MARPARAQRRACGRAAAAAANGRKLGLKIDFDQIHDRPAFLGMRSLVLDNLWQDKTLMREFLAMAIYRRIGEAAPRESFARVYINNEYQGLYAVVEDVTEEFVTRVVGDTGGYLYEYHWLRDSSTWTIPGDDLSDLQADVRAAQSRAGVRQHAVWPDPRSVSRDQRPGRCGLARARGASASTSRSS